MGERASAPAKTRQEATPARQHRLPDNDADLLAQCALFDIHRVSRTLTVLYNAYLRETGLTMAQFTLLRNIAALEPVGITRIGEAMLMDRTSVTRLLEPLVKDGYLQFEAGADRRFKNVRATPAGKAAIRRSEKAWARAQKDLFDKIGSDQWRTLRTSLRDTLRLVRAADEAA